VLNKSKQQPLRLPNSTTTTNVSESEFSCKFCPITFTLEKEFNAHNTALHLQEIFFTAVAEAEKSKTAAAAAFPNLFPIILMIMILFLKKKKKKKQNIQKGNYHNNTTTSKSSSSSSNQH